MIESPIRESGSFHRRAVVGQGRIDVTRALERAASIAPGCLAGHHGWADTFPSERQVLTRGVANDIDPAHDRFSEVGREPAPVHRLGRKGINVLETSEILVEALGLPEIGGGSLANKVARGERPIHTVGSLERCIEKFDTVLLVGWWTTGPPRAPCVSRARSATRNTYAISLDDEKIRVV